MRKFLEKHDFIKYVILRLPELMYFAFIFYWLCGDLRNMNILIQAALVALASILCVIMTKVIWKKLGDSL